MTTIDWSRMTWEEVRDLDTRHVVAVLPTGAMEAHGPHLPLATDIIIAGAMARAGAARLAARGYTVLLLPPLVYTAAGFAAGFPGTITLRPETVTATLVDIGHSLAGHGVTVLAVANAHLDPAHVDAIEAAVAAARAEGRLTMIFPNIARKPWAMRLTEEFKSGACHAGRYESSVVLAVDRSLVRDELRQTLPPNPTSLSSAIREGKTSFEAAGGPRAYFGYPADATAEEGERTIEVLGSILADAVLAARGDDGT